MINDNIPPLQAILKLVEYLESDEAKHYACKLADGEDTSRHIFNDVKSSRTGWTPSRDYPGCSARAAALGTDYGSFRRSRCPCSRRRFR
jgi:hypothetical protein